MLCVDLCVENIPIFPHHPEDFAYSLVNCSPINEGDAPMYNKNTVFLV